MQILNRNENNLSLHARAENLVGSFSNEIFPAMSLPVTGDFIKINKNTLLVSTRRWLWNPTLNSNKTQRPYNSNYMGNACWRAFQVWAEQQWLFTFSFCRFQHDFDGDPVARSRQIRKPKLLNVNDTSKSLPKISEQHKFFHFRTHSVADWD